MGGGPPLIRRMNFEKSNAELTNAIRSNIKAAQEAISSSIGNNGCNFISSSNPYPPSISSWTTRDSDNLYIPTHNFTQSGLAEERDQYDITVKLFYLPGVASSLRGDLTCEAIDLVLRELHVSSIDLLIVSFPGVSFDSDEEEEMIDLAQNNLPIVQGEPMQAKSCENEGEADDVSTQLTTWQAIEKLHDDGIIRKLGLAEFGTHRLSKFLPGTKVKPCVDQINIRDCCVVPKGLIMYAKEQKIELLTHSDCTNILPSGTLRELLGSGEKGAHVLAPLKTENPTQQAYKDQLNGEVKPQWVVKYTAVVKDRGVIENKGYFAVAKLIDET